MAVPGRSSDARDLRAARRGLSRGQRAILWILALALAIFVVTYVSSPKDSPARREHPAASRTTTAGGEAAPGAR